MAAYLRQKKYKAEEVLVQLNALPSDDESNDDLEASDEELCDVTGGLESIPADGEHSQTSESDDDDDILYELVDPEAHADWSEDTSTESSNDDAEEDMVEPEIELGDWKRSQLLPPDINFDNVRVVPQRPFHENESPVDFFNKFFNQDVISNLVDQTNLYAQQNRTKNWQDTVDDEVRAFIGLLIGMGVHALPSFKLFWSTDPLFRVQPIVDIMQRDRFMKLLNNLHVNDNTKTVSRDDPAFDKLHKIRPLLTEMNRQFSEQAVSSSSQTVDEAMVLFKGRSSFRQYMPMKPIKRGYKLWIRADSHTGYVYQVDPYTGKEDSNSVSVGLGSRVVMNLTEKVSPYTHLTFDNFFTSVQLMEDLYKKNIFATGTVRANRREMPDMATRKEVMQKGESKWLTRNSIAYVKWMDTKMVHVLTSAFSPSNILQAKRTQKNGTSLAVPCPEPIWEYTKRMGGVDRFDRYRAMYSVSRKSKRWWLRLLYFFIDAAVVNAFVLYASIHNGKGMNLLQFRVELFRGLVSGFCSRERRSSLQGSSFVRFHNDGKSKIKLMGVPDDVRLQGDHFPERIDKFHRCRLCSTRRNNKRSRIICKKCNVSLCIGPCFAIFHKRK